MSKKENLFRTWDTTKKDHCDKIYYRTLIYKFDATENTDYVCNGNTFLSPRQLTVPFPVYRIDCRYGYSIQAGDDTTIYTSGCNILDPQSVLFTMGNVIDSAAAEVGPPALPAYYWMARDMTDSGTSFVFSGPQNINGGIQISLKSLTNTIIYGGSLVLQLVCYC